MQVVLVSTARAVDGSRVELARPLEIPAVPTVGTTIRIDGRFYDVAGVVYDADYGTYVVGVMPVAADADLPRSRAHLLEWCARHMPAWERQPDGQGALD